eukprot:TRINITY_DN9676_c0_g1_i1.p1 TRINITY_DN9676_c0_g1~~TRINITY_DN9676_c0_g1_i1.p1  ORF type:complete len:426 (+),score=81.27 TRINITY_DN9676_c0_g1_i1:142-1419(+)
MQNPRGAQPQPSSDKMRELSIARVVQDSTQTTTRGSHQPAAEATRALVKYLANPQTIDLVYDKLIDRVIQNNKTPNPSGNTVLGMTITLIKQHLNQYVPSPKTLERLDLFCASILTGENKTNQQNVRQSVQFIRNLIKQKLAGHTPSSLPGSPSPQRLTPQASLAVAQPDLEASPAKRNGHLSKSGTPVPTPKPDRKEDNSQNGAYPDPDTVLVTNYMASEVKLERPFDGGNTLYDTLLFGQFASADLDDEGMRISHQKPPPEQVDVVRSTKKKEEKKFTQAGLVTVRRKLFHYKYYKEQLPLTLNPEEMDLLINAVVNPPNDDHESCLIASKILIKLLVDMYVSDSSGASKLMLSLLFEMLDGKQVFTQIHSFNLLLNLSVHMNLLEEVASLDEKVPSPTQLASYKRIQAIQEVRDSFPFCLCV